MTASGVSVSTGRGTMDESLYANKSLTAPGFWRRAVVRSLRSRCARQVTGAQDAGVRHRPDRVRLGGCAPYVSRPAQETRLFRVQPLRVLVVGVILGSPAVCFGLAQGPRRSARSCRGALEGEKRGAGSGHAAAAKSG